MSRAAKVDSIEERRKDAAFASMVAAVVLPMIALGLASSHLLPKGRTGTSATLMGFALLQLAAVAIALFSFWGMKRTHRSWIAIVGFLGVAIGIPATWVVFVYAGLAGAGP